MLLRCLKTQNGKNLLSFREISDSFSLKNRQDANNYWRDFLECGKDILFFLQRKRKLNESFPLIEEQVLSSPLLDIRDHYRIFCQKHQEFKMSEPTFKEFYSNIDTVKYHNRIKEMIIEGEISPDSKRMLKEVLSESSPDKRMTREIVSAFPEVEPAEKEIKAESTYLSNFNMFGKCILIMFLIASGLNYDVLTILFGVSKGTIHNWFHTLTGLKALMLKSIVRWSGVVSIDEKWLKINGKWHYVLSVVDNVTGFPLFFTLATNLNADTWELFLRRFYQLYGKPDLIITDGSNSLAKARKKVFPGVSFQLCKFHKLKNLYRYIYSLPNGKVKNRCFLLANGIFSNTTYYGRKRAARTLAEMNVPGVSDYVRNNILANWKTLTKGLTSNSAERWNRKIEKVTAKRYGLKNVEFIEQLLVSLWLKEAIKDSRHMTKCFINDIDLSHICQENVNACSIIDLIQYKLLKRSA